MKFQLPFVRRGRYENLYRQLCAEVNYTGRLHAENKKLITRAVDLRIELDKYQRDRDESGRFVKEAG